MPKPKLTPDLHLAELNRQLRQHKDYRAGMEFTPYPEGSKGRAMSGYSVTGPFDLIGIYAQVAHRVSEQFDLEV
jgi:hypothetical protein